MTNVARPNRVRTVTVVGMPLDAYGCLVAPPRAFRYPDSALVRVRIPEGAVDYSDAAVTAVANIVGRGALMVEGPDPQLAAEFTDAIRRRLRQQGQVA